MPPGYARTAVRAMATSRGFDATLNATASRRYLSGPPIDAPVTVAFGSRDVLLLPHQSRYLDELPPDTRRSTLPGCRHVPMAANPVAVPALIPASTARARPGTPRRCESRDGC